MNHIQLSIEDYIKHTGQEKQMLSTQVGPFKSSIDNHRNFLCSNYNICLSYTANRNWPSFTCTGCKQNLNIRND